MIKINKKEAKKRLEYLRKELRAERMSYGELCELQNLKEFIEPGDVELLEAAGVPEFEPVMGPNDMPKQAHTATPWEMEIGSASGEALFSVVPINKGGTVADIYGDNANEAEANAAFIVKACNSHYELVEALSAMHNAFNDVFIQDDSGLCEKALMKAKQALAHAGR